MSQCDQVTTLYALPGSTGPDTIHQRCPLVAVVRMSSLTNPDQIPYDLCRTHSAMIVDWAVAGHNVKLERLYPDEPPIIRAEWEIRIAANKRGRGRLAR